MERIKTFEEQHELAVESLLSFANLHRKESPEEILQKKIILGELLKLLNKNPTDTQSFNILLGLALGENLKLKGSVEKVILFCYDCFVDCVATALPEELSEKFKSRCSRH